MGIYLLIHTHQRGNQEGGRPEAVRFHPSEVCLLLSASTSLETSTSTTSHCSCLFVKFLPKYQLISLKRNEHNIVSSQKKGRKKEKEERRKRGKQEGRKVRGKGGKYTLCLVCSLSVAILRFPRVPTRAMLEPQIPMTVSVLTLYTCDNSSRTGRSKCFIQETFNAVHFLLF